MPNWILLYHVVWTTKNRQALITPPRQTLIYAVITDVSHELRSSVLCIGGIEDHIHVAVSIPPSLAVSEWVGKVKGESAFAVNNAFPALDPHFQWQQGYSAHTFGPQGQSFVMDYITRQKEHHAVGKTMPALEFVNDETRRKK